MKKGKGSRDGHIIDFWQSATDLSLVLVLVLLLIIGMLILYVFQLPEDVHFQIWGTDANIQETDNGNGAGDHDGDYRGDHDGDGEGDENDDGGGGGGGGEDEDEFHERFPIASSGGEDWSKAAVYLTVIDAETRRAIRTPDIIFELYEDFDNGNHRENAAALNGAIRYLYTYYPEKIEFRNYKTRDDGTFYLPEKILQGWYYFKEITEPEGYDSADTVSFLLDDNYDWGDPYVVSVPLYPSKNVILVRLKDEETGEVLTSGEFRVNAAENISTIDGTIRYVNGEQADTIAISDEGVGTSKELYLGKYLVAQSTTPQYYTTADGFIEVPVEKKNGLEPEVYEFFCRKTGIHLRLADDLSGMALMGAGFQLCLDDGRVIRTAETDAFGEVNFTNLDKNTTYILKQSSAIEGYEMDKDSYSFYVDASGRIQGEAKVNVNLTNFIPRAEIQLQDILLHSSVNDQKVSLYNSRDELLKTWVTSGKAEEVENLPKGSYYVQVGNRSAHHEFEITDSRVITKVTIETWSKQSVFTIIAALVFIPAAVYVVILFAAKVVRKKKNGEVPENENRT